MPTDAQIITEYAQEIGVLKEANAQLQHQLDWFKRQLFGQKSERRHVGRDGMGEGEQLSLGDMLDEVAPSTEETQTIKAHKRRKPSEKGKPAESGFEFNDDVPMKEIHLSCPELDELNEDDYELINEEISYRLAQQPSSYVVLKYIRPVVKLKTATATATATAKTRVSPGREEQDQGTQAATIISVPAPVGVLGHSRADVSFIAGMLVDKFAYHLPLYRQHQRLGHGGIKVNRNWLTRITHQACALLKPIHQAVLDSILAGHVIAMDEVPVKAGRAKKGKMHQGYYWPIYGEANEVAFEYKPSRAGKHVAEVLGRLKTDQVLLSDGYSAYENYAKQTGIAHAQCWAHTRRKFIEAESIEPALASEALEQIAELYAVEAQIRKEGLNPQKKHKRRQDKSRPIVKQFFKWVDQNLNEHGLLPSNPMTKALAYTRERKTALSYFLNDAEVAVDTNHLESALRPIPLGRKNWLFCWTEVGAEYVGIIQTLISSCRLQGIDPYDYLVDVLQRIDIHPAKRVAELTPAQWSKLFADQPMRSALYHAD